MPDTAHFSCHKFLVANNSLDRMTRSAITPLFQFGRSWRAPCHRHHLLYARAQSSHDLPVAEGT